MSHLTLKIIFVVGTVLILIIRIPYQQENQNNTIIDERKTFLEKITLFLIFVGMLLLPFIFVFFGWLNFANYSLPNWASILGVFTGAIALGLFWRSHEDLGKNWSPTLQI